MNTQLMKRIARRQKLSKREGIELIEEDWPYLRVRTWAGVARIVGEAKREAHPSARVFVRGQVKNHHAMAPSLFRSEQLTPQALLEAENEFARKLAEQIPVGRFKRPNVGALLQHYGFKTSWLDVLDNLFVAFWFASFCITEKPDGSIALRESGSADGWLFLIRPPASASVIDLRSEHHPLSARPHVQHGVSVRCCPVAVDLRDWVVATIQTPVVGATSGALFTGSALIPSRFSDHTLKLLLKHGASDLAAEIEQSHKLNPGSLGRTSYLLDVA